jgi:hypothetical protein
MNLNFIDGDDNSGAGNNVPVNRAKISNQFGISIFFSLIKS